MEPPRLEFFYDIGSPYSYLASERVEEVAEAGGCTLWWRPFLLEGVFRQVGSDPSVAAGPRRAYMLRDLGRWARKQSLPLRFPSTFPLDTRLAMRALAVVPRSDRGEASHAVFRALWQEERAIGNTQVLTEVLGEEVVGRAGSDEAWTTLEKNTKEALARGAFGSPSFFVGKELFFGNDRLDFVRKVLLEAVE